MNRIEGRLIRDDTTKRIPLGQENRTSTLYGRNNIPWLARGDERLESALPTINLQEQLHTYQLVQNIWEKGAAGMKNHDGSNHRISFKDAFDTER